MAEVTLRVLGIPQSEPTMREFDFPPPDLMGKAFTRDAELFWKLVPGYDGPWTLWKVKYTAERDVAPDEFRRRSEFFSAEPYRQVTWSVNGEGYRGSVADPSKQSILFVGSSVTFGWGVRAAECFPSLIAGKLSSTGQDDWTIINAGVPGYSSFQCREYLAQLLKQHRPRVIVVEVGINDGFFTPNIPDREMHRIFEPNLAAQLINNSNLLSALKSLFGTRRQNITVDWRPKPQDRFYYTSTYIPDHMRVSEEDFRANVAAMEQMARDAGATIWFIIPGLYNEYGDRKLEKSARFEHPREIDLVGAIRSAGGADPGSCFLPYDEAHLSVKGHQVAAEQIWKSLESDVARKPAAVKAQ